MPFYEIEHVCALSPTQHDDIAKAITDIHSQKFKTARLFVNVRFVDVGNQVAYVAGKRRSVNRILARVRQGPSRTQEDYNDVLTQINSAWSSIVGSHGEQELQAIWMGGVTAIFEAGFTHPPAGQDRQWLKEHLGDFRKKAEGGDEDFQELLEELKEREDLKGIV